jgi:hypothetical protein
MFARWRPSGSGCHVIQVDRPDSQGILDRVREALAALHTNKRQYLPG